VISSILSDEWSLELNHFKKLIIGFSGGLDSTVLLHAIHSIPSLAHKIFAVHVNHGISSNAFVWQTHCQKFCEHLGVSLDVHSVQVKGANVEEKARNARYAVFSSLMHVEDCLLLGHHVDDQAETLLLQLFRGSGIDGLAAMSHLSEFEQSTIARPFLCHSREQLAQYAAAHQLTWVEDESNQDIKYSRNYLRQQIMPLLKNRWPQVVLNIARTTIHCQQAKRNLEMLAEQDWGFNKNSDGFGKNHLHIQHIKELSRDRITNILRFWLKNNKIKCPSTVTFERLLDELIFACSDATPEVSWGNISIRRYQAYLYLEEKEEKKSILGVEWSNFPLSLNIKEIGNILYATKAKQGLVIPPNVKIMIRWREGGETIFLHGQSKRLKKLFQEWKIPPWLRERIPLIYFNDTLAAVAGYAISDLFFSENSVDAWVLNINKENYE
jgi:tRNA(Ile)-lysidine synthase